MNPAYMDRLGKKFAGLGTEHEVIHLGNQPMKTRLYIKKYDEYILQNFKLSSKYK